MAGAIEITFSDMLVTEMMVNAEHICFMCEGECISAATNARGWRMRLDGECARMANALDGECASMANALGWRMRFDGECAWMANAL